MHNRSVQDLLGDFRIEADASPKSLKEGRPVTIWLPAEAKAKYDLLQKKSGRRFNKKVREVLIELIGLAEQRIS